ncbi:proton-coupled folate transporter-like isoform X2 [Anneissia japonica]|uniref:proton-coupled folate transporter-like isoform X2 n=1 Tax=Anneissia japonica TaxID=1529436 RepID=UPI00142561C1|nr:proton-coupled folate transporter-like isoform X2 [Anneissia japonica]
MPFLFDFCRGAPVEITVLIAYLAISLLSIQGVVFTEYVVLLELNSTSEDVDPYYTQVLVANWTTIFLVCQSLPAIFIMLYVLTWSDRFGRKFTMILPTIGLLGASISFTIVYVYGLQIEYLLIGYLSIGLTGNTILHRSGAGSYISDTCTHSNLTLRMTILLGINYLGIALGQLCFSVWIDTTGFLQPFIFMTALLAFSIFYTACLMEESIDPRQVQQEFSFKDVVADIINVIMSNRNNRRKLMLLLMSARVVNSVMINAFFYGIQLYAIGPPLYMSTSAAGYYTFAFLLSNAVAVPLTAMAALPKAIIEAQLPKLVEKNERGAIFAQSGVLDNLGFLLGPVWIGVTYSATVETIPGLIFYIMCAGALVTMLLIVYIQLKFGSVEEMLARSSKTEEEYISASEETYLLSTSSIGL